MYLVINKIRIELILIFKYKYYRQIMNLMFERVVVLSESCACKMLDLFEINIHRSYHQHYFK